MLPRSSVRFLLICRLVWLHGEENISGKIAPLVTYKLVKELASSNADLHGFQSAVLAYPVCLNSWSSRQNTTVMINNARMRTTLLFAALVSVSALLAGCATMSAPPGAYRSPFVADFPDTELPFVVRGNSEEIANYVAEQLAQSGIQSRREIIARDTYVITAYAYEPIEIGARRLRRVAHMFRIQPDPKNPLCSQVGLRWLVQSRGIHEELWQTTSEDTGHKPSNHEAFVRPLIERRCE